MKINEINFNIIGEIHTPYTEFVPPQPKSESPEDFYIRLNKKFIPGINNLKEFNYIHIIFLFHSNKSKKKSLEISLPWLEGKKIGVFASRSLYRPNPIGLSVARILKIQDDKIFIDSIDVFDGTPLLDIKPYMSIFDLKQDANNGWMTEEVIKKIHQFSPEKK